MLEVGHEFGFAVSAGIRPEQLIDYLLSFGLGVVVYLKRTLDLLDLIDGF